MNDETITVSRPHTKLALRSESTIASYLAPKRQSYHSETLASSQDRVPVAQIIAAIGAYPNGDTLPPAERQEHTLVRKSTAIQIAVLVANVLPPTSVSICAPTTG
jgi:hypothetical protein